MLEAFSVNQVIEQLETLAGQDITVTGLFSFGFEDVCIRHWPKAERHDDYESSIWLSTGSGALRFDMQTCERLSGRRVVVQGTLIKPNPFFKGCGHMSLWPAEIVARTLELHRG